MEKNIPETLRETEKVEKVKKYQMREHNLKIDRKTDVQKDKMDKI